MNRIVMKSKVGHDDTLHLALPLGTAVTASNPSDWAAWVDSLAESWEGDFERPPQGAFEVSELLS